ncbi:lytic transglycosylase domain-containing protein [Pseudooceanicola aestuarii]|uniref:lytic transglycosylase domain-containing protein n=1 Tax=Pseudooceanicola aestuarii TaxID=2697319 RepID=UPI0013D15506|nr:lytic transglycosylase domain-containing protein [Pseudooceanicola aestuarii]
MCKAAFGALLIGAVTLTDAQADVLGSKARKTAFRSQTGLLDRRASQQYNTSVRLQPPSVNTPTKWSNPAYTGRYRGEFLDMARSAALRHEVPEGIFLRLVEKESNWQPTALSHKGAIGLAQLMPDTAARLGVDPQDPFQNLDGGARYLAKQYRDFGSWRLALAAYNAGPGAVRQYNDVPPYAETQDYVRVIWGE